MLYFPSKLYYGTWLFCFINILKNRCFFSNFSAGRLHDWGDWLFLWNFKK